MTGKYLTSNNTFSKKVNPTEYRIQIFIYIYIYIYIYILVRTRNLLFMYFTGVSNQAMKSINCKKKPSNLIKVISSYNINSGTKSQQAKKSFAIQYQKLLIFFQNFSVPFHQIMFDYSISCVLLIDRPNESCKNSQTFERSNLSTKKLF